MSSEGRQPDRMLTTLKDDQKERKTNSHEYSITERKPQKEIMLQEEKITRRQYWKSNSLEENMKQYGKTLFDWY